MKRFLRLAGRVSLIVMLLLLVITLWVYWQLDASLPQLDGRVTVSGLQAEVAVLRDAQGVPAIRGNSRLDVARALGYVHAQERFFQMDLLRRRAAGELSALVGSAALELDKKTRLHRFRARASTIVEKANPADRQLLTVYTEGVNAGLQALSAQPFEYSVLRVSPQIWKTEDCILAVYSMYLTLQSADGSAELGRQLAKEKLPDAMFQFLSAAGSEWDAPLIGDAIHATTIPSAVDLVGYMPQINGDIFEDSAQDDFPGSNNWAISGSISKSGGAILANDMHLGISVPNTWYRAQLIYRDADKDVRVVGVTLPGAPLVVVGSNESVAWGFTNTYGDWSDVIRLQQPDPEHYVTTDGVKALQHREETIYVKDEPAIKLDIAETEWGPVIYQDATGRSYVYRWVAHDVEQAINLGLAKLETAQSALEALSIAKTTRIPAQNFVVADKHGGIGWTIAGAIPRRVGFSGRLPSEWHDGAQRWDGYLSVGEYPEVVNPIDGRIWTANARVVSGEALAIVGDGGYDLGARAQQIRNGLFSLLKADERDMLAIQLDDRAVLLARWQQHLTQVLNDKNIEGNEQRKAFRDLIVKWEGRATIDSVSYRLVRGFRFLLRDAVYKAWLADVYKVNPHFRSSWLSGQWESVLWKVINDKPAHLLPQPYTTWDEFELAVLDKQIEVLTKKDKHLERRTWGEKNTVAIQHPLARFIPFVGRYLNAPLTPLAGDANMPRVVGANNSASERLVVSPGHEANAIFHMPTSQSGHPMSPYFMVGHEAWVKGEPTPLLPGDALYSLYLQPISRQ